MSPTRTIMLYTPAELPAAAQFADRLAAALAPAGLLTQTISAAPRLAERAAPAALVAWTFLRDEHLRQLNRLALERAIPLLFCSSRAGGTQIGPAVLPGQPGCLECFDQQLALFPAAAPHCARESAGELEPPAHIGRLAAALAAIGSGPLAAGRLIECGPEGERTQRTLATPLCLACSSYANHPIHMFVTPLPQRG